MTTHVHLELRLGLSTAIPPLPRCLQGVGDSLTWRPAATRIFKCFVPRYCAMMEYRENGDLTTHILHTDTSYMTGWFPAFAAC